MKTNRSGRPAAATRGERERIRSARRGLFVYFAILVPLSTLCYVMIPKSSLFILLLMWAPGLSSIAARWLLREGIRDISLRVKGKKLLKSLPFILLFPAAIGLVAYGIAWMTGLVQFAAPDRFIKAPPAVIFLGFLLVQLIGGTAVGVISSSGEELGWRGYMLTRLIDARVPYPILTSGIIWGLWHLPVMLEGLYYSGPYPALSIALFMVSVTSFGVIIGRLRLATGSIWPAILLHACWNAVIQDVFDSFSKGKNVLLWTGESGIFVALALLASAWAVRDGRLSIERL